MFGKIKARFYKAISDKRKYPRVPLSVRVTTHDGGLFTYYHATNISAGGMFLKADEPLALGMELQLQFTLPEQEEVMVSGVVIRRQAYDQAQGYASGMGIRFIDAPAAARRAIKAFVDKTM